MKHAANIRVVTVLFMLPDKRVVLHRRDSQAPTSPNKLALFGGHIEEDESPDEAIKREVAEETSLDVITLNFVQVGRYHFDSHHRAKRGIDYYFYIADIPDADFEVFEGTGSEVYDIASAYERADITTSLKLMVEHLIKGR